MVLPDGGQGALEAIERQSRAPDDLVTGGEPDRQADWFWLVDGSVSPEPTALERLLEALERLGPLPAPALLSSKVVTRDGSLDPGSAPVPDIRSIDVAVAAYQQGVVAVRIARRGSLLVRRPPAGADTVWTARLLKRELGLLVPGSVAVRSTPREPARLGERVALLCSDALELREKPWFVLHLTEDAVGGFRDR